MVGAYALQAAILHEAKCNPLTLGACGKEDPTNWGVSKVVGRTRQSRLVELSDFADSVCLPNY